MGVENLIELLRELLIEKQFWIPLTAFFLFVVPRFFSQLGIPAAITSFAFGAIAAYFIPREVITNPQLTMLATFGIVTLFFSAGIEIEPGAVKRGRRWLLPLFSLILALIFLFSYLSVTFFSVSLVIGVILTLALLTPSGGFIFDSLYGWKFSESATEQIKLAVICLEIIALAIFFVVLKINNPWNLMISVAVMGGAIILLPLFLSVFLRKISKHSPHSEVGVFILLAILFGMISKELGVYYLVGAFLAGLVASRFMNFVQEEERHSIHYSLKTFTALFIPIYFFSAGLRFDANSVTWESFGIGVGLMLIVMALKTLFVFLVFRFLIQEKIDSQESIRRSMALLPNLVFGLVLADTLLHTLNLDPTIVNAVIIATLLMTVLAPSIIKRLTKKSLTDAELSRP